MPTFPDPPGQKGPFHSNDALLNPGLLGGAGSGGFMPKIGGQVQNFIPQTGGGGLTLQALMERQRMLQRQQEQNISQPQGTILGGLGQVAGTVFNALNMRKAEREQQAGTEEIVQAISQMPESGIASPEILAAVGRRDPNLMLQLYQGAMEARNAAAKQEHWEDFPAPEGGQPGAIYQRNRVTGEVREVGGASGTTVNVGGAGDKKWNEVGAQKFGERVDAYSAEGVAARQLKTQVGQLRDIMVDMPTGLDAKATSYLRENWGISLGEGTSKIEAFNAIVNRLVPSQRPAGAGTMSDKDIDLYKSSLPSYLGTPEGNAMVMSTMEGIANYNIALGDIADQVLQIEDPREARRVFNEKVNALPDPLAAWRAAEAQRKKGKPGTTTPPADDDDGIIVGPPVER